MDTYKNDDVTLEAMVDGFRIHRTHRAPPHEGYRTDGRYGYEVTTAIVGPPQMMMDYAFMKAVLFDKLKNGPLDMYSFLDSDEYTAFLDNFQLDPKALAMHLVQYGILDRLGKLYFVLDDLKNLEVSLTSLDALVAACTERDAAKVNAALAQIESEIPA